MTILPVVDGVCRYIEDYVCVCVYMEDLMYNMLL